MSAEMVRYLQGYVWRQQVPRTREEWEENQKARQWSREMHALARRVQSGELTREQAFPGAQSHGDIRERIRAMNRDLIRPLPWSDDPRDWDYRYTTGKKLVRGTERWKP